MTRDPCPASALAFTRSGYTLGSSTLFDIAKYSEAVYILHAFEKKTRRTERRDIDLAKHRLAQVMKHRENIRGRDRKGEPS